MPRLQTLEQQFNDFQDASIKFKRSEQKLMIAAKQYAMLAKISIPRTFQEAILLAKELERNATTNNSSTTKLS
jgi:hypothetical protein